MTRNGIEKDRNVIYERHFNKIIRLNQIIVEKIYVTINELVFLSSFVLNSIIGELIRKFAPQEEVNNYWNDKRNLFNQWFVKKGWLWTTIVLILFYTVTIIKHRKERKINYGAIVIRYMVSTLWWVFFTQWCFGLPIMDKIFVWSGGYCVVDSKTSKIDKFISLFDINQEKNLLQSNVISSYSCRKLKGSWEGGHDPSGHVFLLVHSSLFLFFEIKQYWKSWSYIYENCKRNVQEFKSSRDWNQIINIFLLNPQVIVILLMSLWWFMLLMTNAYFHSLFEKLAGLLFGYFGIVVIYYLPRLYYKQMDV